eukprot:3276005-Karenia_brevis.AAC.1
MSGIGLVQSLSLGEPPLFANASPFLLRFKEELPKYLVYDPTSKCFGLAALKAMLAQAEQTEQATHLDQLHLFR